jgi:hypothetical protein
VSTLDHYLPKSRFPALSVAPINLVPACSDCNHAKLHRSPTTASDAFLHPYFDHIETDVWLRAEVVLASPAAIRFHVLPPPHWTAVLAARVNLQFTVLGLSALYASQAADELCSIRYSLTLQFDAGGAPAVRTTLLDREASYGAYRTNSWQRAMYSALAGSTWFCEEGFRA